ncbi:MAG: protein kinase, partial [Planctomycetota bacterium]
MAETGRMIGTTLGPHRIDAELGTGAMGSVYLAEVVGDAAAVPRGERVALKVIHLHLLSKPGFFKRFLREAEAGKRVEHENVVRTHDVDALEV